MCVSGFLEIHDLVSSERWMRRNGMQGKKSWEILRNGWDVIYEGD